MNRFIISENLLDRETLVSILEIIKCGIVVLRSEDGEEFFIQDANRSFLELENLQKHDIINQNIKVILPKIREIGLFEVLQRVLVSGEKERFSSYYSI